MKLEDIDQFFLGRVIDGSAAVRNHLCFCDHGLLFSFVENVLQLRGELGELLDPRAHEDGTTEEGLPLLRLDAVEHVEELDDVPAGIADLVIRFYLLLGQVVLWLVAECTFPGVFAYGHATFFGAQPHLLVLLRRDPGVQVQGAPGQVFRPFLLLLHIFLPFKSMRACERSGANVGQAASRIVRHWYFSLMFREKDLPGTPLNNATLLLPVGIALEPEDGEHLIDAVHHSGTVAVQDLFIGKVGGDDGRKFPVIAVGDQILNGCVICTIALASLRFRTEIVQEEVLRPEEFLIAGRLFLQLVLEMGVQIISRDVDHGRGELLI